MPSSETHAELQAEQSYLDNASSLLTQMQERTAVVKAASDRAVREENTVDARIAQWHLLQRQNALAAGSGPLCFGRIDDEEGDRWYVGRRHVEDEQSNAVVVDWRAPVSAPFYRATAVDPCGLIHRRRFSCDGAELVAIFDEDLTDPDGESHGGLPDPLLAELERSRTGQMRDIVSTIAAEQDEIIRSGLDELLIVQGGPGTGKTAVGLHRAAYLLFSHRDLLHEQRVLVVGPNPVFLRYIADVLPSLGETSVVQTTLSGLLSARFRVRAADTDAAAAVKGDIRMASVIERLIADKLTVPADGLELRSGLSVVRMSDSDLYELQQQAFGRNLPSNKSRETFRTMIAQEAWRRHLSRAGVDPAEQPHFTRGLLNDGSFKKAFDKMWPNLSAPVLVRELLGSPTKRRRAADGILSPAEQDLLVRKASKKLADEQWTAPDIPLIDEATLLTTGVPTTYGHVVVDEAQDISPMGLRMLARRARKGSMTVLGDLAQATAPASTRSWDDAQKVLSDAVLGESSLRLCELTVGYRVPSSILDVANALLPEAAPGVTPARSVRPGGDPPLVVRTTPELIAAAVVSEVEALSHGTSVAVVGIEEHLLDIEVALDLAAVANTRASSQALAGASAVTLIDPDQVKGLEFDAVIVVEPAAIAQLDHGLRRLYVSLTRSVQSLGIVCSRPLPGAIETSLRKSEAAIDDIA